MALLFPALWENRRTCLTACSSTTPSCNRSQRVSGNGVYSVVEPDAHRGAGQCGRCSPATGGTTLAGGIIKLRRDQTGEQRLHHPGRQPHLADCAQRCPCGPSRRRRSGRGTTRWIAGSALSRALPGHCRVPAASQGAEAENNSTQACRASREKPMDEQLPLHQSGEKPLSPLEH
jgi:hypothetical protein